MFPRIIVARDYSPISFKLKQGILPPLTEPVFDLEDYFSYQAKIVLAN